MTLEREYWELVAQLLPSDGAWSSSTTELVVGKSSIDDECLVKVESSAGGGLPADTSSPRALSMADAAACGGTTRRRRKRGQQVNKDEHHDEAVEPAAGSNNPQQTRRRCSKRSRREQHSTSLVTSVPDFDGYQWKKYGQKQIEGAMYPRSYYRCIRSAEQGCPAKRTVQRNDDDHHHGITTMGGGDSPKYTVVYVAEHTCAANDSTAEAAPVILETTAAVVAAAPNKRPRRLDAAASAGGSTSSPSSIATGTESPATSDDVTWSSADNNKEDRVNDDDLYDNGLFAVDDRSSLLVHHQDMDDFTGPIRSPVHIATGGCWTIDQCLLHLVNDPIISHFSAAGFSSF